MDLTLDCKISDIDQVYDGDTIQNVRLGMTIPGLEIGFYLFRDIRISGIDTPERRPKKAGRSLDSLLREKEAAEIARLALQDLLLTNDLSFTLTDIRHGKYAGRVIADCYVRDVKISDYMIQNGYAQPYDGKLKPTWNF